MKIYRIETLEFHPDPVQTIDDIRAILAKTQDLTYDRHDVIETRKSIMVVVKRQVELFPDTIK